MTPGISESSRRSFLHRLGFFGAGSTFLSLLSRNSLAAPKAPSQRMTKHLQLPRTKEFGAMSIGLNAAISS